MTALSRHRSFGGGRICVDIERAHEPIAHVRLDLPDAASLVLAGKSAAEAVPFVPALYAVCGHAHGAASAGALAVAEGRTVAPRLAAAREALADMEAMREGIVRCALAWPQIVGANDRPHPVRTVIVLVAALRRALFGDRDPFASDAEPADDLAPALRLVDQAEAALLSAALAEPAAAWLARRDPARIAEWASAGATPAARLIDLVLRRGWAGDGAVPRVSLGDAGVSRIADLLAGGSDARGALDALRPCMPETRLLDADAPSWICREVPGEPGGEGLLARLLALLSGLAQLPGRMRHALLQGAPSTAPIPVAARPIPGYGFCAIQSPRGLLMHSVALEHGRITRYHVIVPTRLNFDAEGVAARALRRLAEIERGDDALLTLKARLVVAAIGPCVGCEVRVR